MSESGKNKKPGLRRFLQYRKGELSGAERNSFERELQKDPFAEEAMEGMLSVTPEEFSADVKNMRAILQKSRLRKRFIYYRVAASVAVLMIISSVFFVLNRSNRLTVLSTDTGVQETAEILKPEPVIKQDNVLQGNEEKTASVNEGYINKGDKKAAEKEKLPETVENKNIETTIPENNRAAEPSAKSEHPEQLTENNAPQLKDFNKEAGARSLMRPAPAGAMIKGNDVITDSMPVPEALDEVVVTGYGRQKKEIGEEDYIPPAPVNGMDDFNSYIEKNIHRPDSLAGQRVVVVAGLSVNADGSIDSIRIIRSPGQQFSEEAVRLIRTGPKWLPASKGGEKINDSVRVRIVFR